MALKGETIATGAPTRCPDCKKNLVVEVLHSNAGYYIGTWCDCGPNSRESGYYRRSEDAQRDLDSGNFNR
jgi:hypothetical protein